MSVYLPINVYKVSTVKLNWFVSNYDPLVTYTTNEQSNASVLSHIRRNINLLGSMEDHISNWWSFLPLPPTRCGVIN